MRWYFLGCGLGAAVAVAISVSLHLSFFPSIVLGFVMAPAFGMYLARH